MKTIRFFARVFLCLLFASSVFSAAFAEEPAEIKTIPEGAVVLFAGTSTELFADKLGNATDWQIVDRSLVSTAKDTRSNHAVSKLHFRDAHIHVEFNMDEASHGNSGIYIHGHYEVQIYDSRGKDVPDVQDMGALYGIHAPLVHAGKAPGEWQTFEIRYVAPRRDSDGKIVKKGRVSVWLNGQQVLDNVEFEEPVSQYHPYRYRATPYLQTIEKRLLATSIGPVFLQDHDSPCRFRNIWIKPLDSKAFFYETDKED